MNMAKTKYMMHQCAYCRRETKMEFVGSQPNENNEAETVKMWYRCSKCKHTALLTLSSEGQTKKKVQPAALIREQCTPYSKQKTFTIGEQIYHSDLDDMGRVVRKDKMSNGVHSIVVVFEKLGERKLLENIPEEIVENETV
jgi:DNA-directed RNA polymerase subunit RPC12/RpoP